MKHDDSELQSLGEEIAREQDAWLDAQPIGRLRLLPRPVRTARLVWVVASFLVLGSVGAWVSLQRVRPTPLVLYVAEQQRAPNEFLSAPDADVLPLRFSNGSQIRLGARSRARVVEVTDRGAHLLLETGSAEVSVVPERGGRWKITAGPFVVEVTGTRFHIAWDAREQALQVALIEGKVAVSGCALGEARPLLAGETLRASCRAGDFEIRRAPPSSAAAARSATPPAPIPAKASTLTSPATMGRPQPAQSAPHAQPVPESRHEQSTPRAAPREQEAAASWQALARAGRFHDALTLVHASRVHEQLAGLSAEELILLGDVGRLSADSALALRAYAQARALAPNSQVAASAAFAIGTIQFDRKRDYAAAARSFAEALEAQASGPLAREALGRQLESLARANDRVQAAARARLYLERYPEGPHAQLARTLVR